MQHLPTLPAQLTENYAAILPREVSWGYMDAANHVNNTVYIRWAETARIAFWELADLPIRQDLGPVVARVNAKYIFPVQFPDRVWMGTRFVRMIGEMFMVETLIVSEKHQRAACLIETSGVMFDYQQQKKAPEIPGMAAAFQAAQDKYLGKPVPKGW